MYSFILMSPWWWKFTAKTFRTVHGYGKTYNLYNLCAYIGIHKWLLAQLTEQILDL